MRRALAAVLVLVGCGRLGFDPYDPAEGGAPDASMTGADGGGLDAPVARCAESCGGMQYCASPDGACGEPGSCVAIPLGCQADYAPVCGCDGVTYDNDCLARQSGASIAFLGPCSSQGPSCTPGCAPDEYCAAAFGTCGGIGSCVARPEPTEVCQDVPVCGCDGTTYSNHCDAARAGVSVVDIGPCGVGA